MISVWHEVDNSRLGCADYRAIRDCKRFDRCCYFGRCLGRFRRDESRQLSAEARKGKELKKVTIELPQGGTVRNRGQSASFLPGLVLEYEAPEIIIEGEVKDASAPEPRPFDLEAAKAGAPMVTRDGRKARFLAHVPEAVQSAQIIAMIEGSAVPCYFHENGKFINRFDDRRDLFMAPKPKRTVWVNFYPGFAASYFGGEAIAKKGAEHDCIAVAVPVEIDA